MACEMREVVAAWFSLIVPEAKRTHLNVIVVVLRLGRRIEVGAQGQVVHFRTLAQVHSLLRGRGAVVGCERWRAVVEPLISDEQSHTTMRTRKTRDIFGTISIGHAARVIITTQTIRNHQM